MGSGRASGFYKQQERKANPEFAAECQAEAECEERRRRCWEAKMYSEQEERERERESQREDHRQDNGGSSADKENRSRQPQQPQQPQTGQKWKREEFEEPRRKTWSEYDKAFTEFCACDFGTGSCFNVSAIPLPPIGHAPVAPSATQEEWDRNIKRAALRWHPDKWATLTRMLDGEPEQQARLKQLCEKMFRSVTLCRDRGFRMRASGTVGGA